MRKLPDLLLISGQLCTSALWKDIVPAISNVARVHMAAQCAYDSIKSIADKILEHAPDTFSLCAHAMGGFIAFEILRTAPQRVERLALLDTLATPDYPEQIARRLTYTKLVERGNFLDVLQTRIPILLHPDRVSETELVNTVVDMAWDTGEKNFATQQKAIIGRADSRPNLADILCNTLVIAGDADGIVPLERTRELVDGIPRSRLVLIEQCGHLTPLEKPVAVSQALLDWIQD